MNKPKVVTDGLISLNLADVKCFKIKSIREPERKSFLIVEFKTRYGYILNPESGKSEKQEYNDKTELEFDEYEMATAYKRDWDSAWQDYLEEQI